MPTNTPMKTAVTTMNRTTANDTSQQPTRARDVQQPTGHMRDPISAYPGVTTLDEISTVTTDTLGGMDVMDGGRMVHDPCAEDLTT